MENALELLRSMKQQPVQDHSPDVDALNAALARCHERLILMRCEDPNPGTRADGLAWLRREADRLAARSEACGGTEYGWTDEADVFADRDQVFCLKAEICEVAAGPYPLGPLGDDPFGRTPPRLLNGKLAS